MKNRMTRIVFYSVLGVLVLARTRHFLSNDTSQAKDHDEQTETSQKGTNSDEEIPDKNPEDESSETSELESNMPPSEDVNGEDVEIGIIDWDIHSLADGLSITHRGIGGHTIDEVSDYIDFEDPEYLGGLDGVKERILLTIEAAEREEPSMLPDLHNALKAMEKGIEEHDFDSLVLVHRIIHELHVKYSGYYSEGSTNDWGVTSWGKDIGG